MDISLKELKNGLYQIDRVKNGLIFVRINVFNGKGPHGYSQIFEFPIFTGKLGHNKEIHHCGRGNRLSEYIEKAMESNRIEQIR